MEGQILLAALWSMLVPVIAVILVIAGVTLFVGIKKEKKRKR